LKRSLKMVAGGVYGVVAFASIGGVLFGLDQGNWGGAITKEGFQRNFCLQNEWGTENGTCADDGKLFAGQSCWNPLVNERHPPATCVCENACLSQDATEWSSRWALFISCGSGLMQFGAMFGALFLAPIVCVKNGRREGLFLGALIAAVGNFGQALVTNWVLFIIMRILDGLGVGVITFSLPMFVSEISPVEVRGRLGCMMQLTMVVGTVIASLMNQQPWFSYAWSFSMPAYPAVIVAGGIFLFPRSPRFAIMKANRLGTPEVGQKEAYDSLMVLRNNDTEAVKEEIQDINESLADDFEEKPWSYIFGNKTVVRRLIIASMLQWLQQFSGINALLGMGPTICAILKEQMDPLVGATIINVCNLIFTVFMAVVIDMFGRRILLLAGAAGMAVFMLVAAYFATTIENLQELDPPPADLQDQINPNAWTMFFCLCAYISFFAIGWGGVPWVYPSEIFPMDVKEKCLSVSVAFQWLANSFIAFIVPLQLNLLGQGGTFIFYGVCLVFATAYVFFQIPETKGVKMEDMDALFGSSEEATKIVYDGQAGSFACSVDQKARRPSQVAAAGGASFSEMTPSRRGSEASGTPKQRSGSRVMKGPGASFTLVA